MSRKATILVMSLAAFAQAADPDFQKDIRPILESTCIKCHGSEKQKGGVEFASLIDDISVLRRRKVWRKAIVQIEHKQMPPEESKELAPAQRDMLLTWMNKVVDVRSVSVQDPGPSVIRRLTRTQYDLTMRELTGIDFDVAERVGIPEDGGGPGFDNVANALNLPPALLDKYFAAADRVLDKIFDTGEASDPLAKSGKNIHKKAYAAIFIAKPGKELPERDAALKIIERFAHRAYRRPVLPAEVQRLMGFYDKALAAGGAFDNGVRAMLKPVLVSPNFLFRLEQSVPQGNGAASRVNDIELATRLSYFLWSNMPDDALVAVAERGKLSDPAVLQEQLTRMLASPKARALTENFAAQWLQIKKLAAARPSTEFFPTFKEPLKKAMYEETATFFDKLREEDRSVLELLDCDYTYVNKELAKHYNIPGIDGDKMQRVTLKPEDHRGGLLGMSSMLALTSHTSRTSPTLRGRWILDVVFGTPPPPPPPDAGQLKEEKQKGKEPKTFRELMAMHATQASCAGCHCKMDPLGFALENYDAIGAWRDNAGGKPVDASGELPGGVKFSGPQELKSIVLKRKDDFVRNMTEQMLAFALGRELDYFDDATVAQIQSSLEKNGYKFSVLVGGIVNSFEFQNRRNVSNVK